MSYIHKFPCKIGRLLVYLCIYLNKLLKLKLRRVAWDYYYIEIVKCYLCLALNHQNGALTLPCGSFEGPVVFVNLKKNIWFAVQVVRLVPEGVHKHRLSPVVWLWKWRSKYFKGKSMLRRLVRDITYYNCYSSVTVNCKGESRKI